MTDLTKEQAIEIFLALDGAEAVRGCDVEQDDDSCEDGPIYHWHAEVRHHGRWYPATIPDHWPDGAEIMWT